jgi:hypothetical protein
LIPIFCKQAYPGDTFRLSMTGFARVGTLLFPIMDNLYFDTFFFAIPNRLVWTNWQAFNGEQSTPSSSTSFTIPTGTSPASTGYAANSLQDYFGLLPGVPGIVHTNLPMRAYNLVWNTWFKDQNLQSNVTVDTGNGPDTVSNYTLLQRGKRYDYFTSCLPWTQKINDGTTVGVSLSGFAPVTGIAKYDQNFPSSESGLYDSTGATVNYANTAKIDTVQNDVAFYVQGTAATGGYPSIQADLNDASAITINALRQAVQLQRFFERDARGGTRYTEIVKSHFGVVHPDLSWRPEFLGGGSTPINVNPVAVTSASAITGSTQYTGDLSAFATVHAHGHGFSKSFTEHNIILGLAMVRADYTYQNGVDREWFYSTRYDFYWPAFAHLGEQAVLNQEIYVQGTGHTAADQGVFGYQERYAELRFMNSRVSGEFRSTYSTPLDAWHLAQNFTSLPTLGATFIVENPPMSRVKAVTSEPDFIMDVRFDTVAVRPMPMYGIPGGLDRF